MRRCRHAGDAVEPQAVASCLGRDNAAAGIRTGRRGLSWLASFSHAAICNINCALCITAINY